MKALLLTFLFTCCGLIALAQPKTYSSFRNYFVVNMNPDMVYSHKNDPVRYLNDLLRLEYSRFTISDHFGNDLENIGKLAHQQKSELGTAMYNYQGFLIKNHNLVEVSSL